MTRIIRIGHITPSSNTVLEPLTYAINNSFGRSMSHHFARTPVTHIALNSSSEAQFHLETMLSTAHLLADAPLDAIVWNGTSASWRGIDKDQVLCEAITKETGLLSSSSTLAFYKAFRELGLKTVGLALPYSGAVSSQIAAEYIRQGFIITDIASLGLFSNNTIGRSIPM